MEVDGLPPQPFGCVSYLFYILVARNNAWQMTVSNRKEACPEVRLVGARVMKGDEDAGPLTQTRR